VWVQAAVLVRPSGGSGSGNAVPTGVATAQKKQVAKLSGVDHGVPAAPSASVSGVSRFKGRTVYYIPLVQQIPGFVVTAQTMKQALAKAGLSLQVCDRPGAAERDRRVRAAGRRAKAAGIITDAIPYGMAQNALDAAKARGVPIIIADQYPPAGATNTSQVTYVAGRGQPAEPRSPGG